MAKRQMFKTAEYAAIIFDMLHDDEELPAWIQSKLTKIADYIGVVKHYLEYDKVVDGYPANRKDTVKEASTEKQRKWCCAQAGAARKNFKGKPSLTNAEAEECCADTKLSGKKKK